MRTILILLLSFVLLLPLAPAQGAPDSQPCGGGFSGGQGGGFGGGPPGGGAPNGTRPPRNGTGQGGGPRNGTGAGGFRGGEPLPELNLSMDPATGELGPGESATATLTLRNDGAAPLTLNLTTNGFGRGNATPMIATSVTPESLSLDAGATQTASVSVRIDASSPTGCAQNVIVLAREVGTNRTAIARLVVTIPAAPPAPAPSATQAASSDATTSAPAKSPGFDATLVAIAGIAAALALVRKK